MQINIPSILLVHSIQPVHPKGDQSWVFIGGTDAEVETSILWPPDAESWLFERPWYWERLKAGGEGDDRGRDSWMASPTQWTWVWVDCGSWWWTGKHGVLRFMVSQRVGHDWVTELNWTEFLCELSLACSYIRQNVSAQSLSPVMSGFLQPHGL